MYIIGSLGKVGMRVRERRPSDLGVIVGWVSNPTEVRRWAGDSLTFPTDAAQLRAHAKALGHCAWVIERDERTSRPVGRFELSGSGGRARLMRVIVDPEQRGQGLGRALLEAPV